MKFFLFLIPSSNTETLVISKRLKFPQDRTDISFIAPVKMHFLRSKSALDSLKRVFNVFGRKLSLGAPSRCQTKKNNSVTLINLLPKSEVFYIFFSIHSLQVKAEFLISFFLISMLLNPFK